MKKRILTFGVVLVFAAVLAVPGTVLADTTVVSGTVQAGYVFQAPSAIELGGMSAGAAWYANSLTPGYLGGNSPTGYTVTGADTKATNAGYMTTGVGTRLTNKLEITDNEFDIGWVTADVGKTWVDSTGPVAVDIDLYVKQFVEYIDTPGSYSLNITFTLTEKS